MGERWRGTVHDEVVAVAHQPVVVLVGGQHGEGHALLSDGIAVEGPLGGELPPLPKERQRATSPARFPRIAQQTPTRRIRARAESSSPRVPWRYSPTTRAHVGTRKR
jgi:hypothetical protein